MEPILQVQNLTKIFAHGRNGNLTAVNDINFELMPGECLGIIGESGSGKTTVANLTARLLNPTEGKIILDGEDITQKNGRALYEVYRKIQMVFQTPTDSFDPRLTLGDGISEGLINHGFSKKAAAKETARLLEQCGLAAEYAFRYPYEVSGGQCQRAAIARAIGIRPRLLICDEATSALDVTIQRDIIELLNELRSEMKAELSILFISHDISLVQQFCDRVLVMHQGHIAEQGRTQDIIYHPQSDYTKSLIECAFEI